MHGSAEETNHLQNFTFLHKAEAKKETEKLIALRNKKLPIKKKSFNFGVHALSLQIQIKYFAIKKQKLICSLYLE